MAYRSNGGHSFIMGEKLYQATLFLKGGTLKRSNNKPEPC